MRITITDKDHPMFGKSGTVKRRRMRDDSAFVNMDDLPPKGVRLFPPGDPRGNHIELYPEECEEEQR